MLKKNKKYNFPAGYSLLKTLSKSTEFLDNPIKFISKSMDAFSGTYSASLGINRKLILTQDPGFINYVLKENHKNYDKSKLSTERAVEFFGRGLLLSNGSYWLKQRRLIQPAFHRERIKDLYGIVIQSLNDLLKEFPTGESVDIYEPVHRVSFTILIRSLFDIDLPAERMTELSRIFTELQDFLIRDINLPLRRLLYPFTGIENQNRKKTKRLREILKAIIIERRTSKNSYVDLLDMLLKSRYEDTGESMTDDQVTDELLIIIFAGHETTANTLSWLLYLLASDQTVLQKLGNSLDLGSVYDSLQDEYLKATINEAMRLFPAAWMTERVAINDDRFGDISFPKNTIIIPFFFGLHRNKERWKDAGEFLPERFITDETLIKSKNFFPFGAGPRMCIGNNFAMAEMSFFVYSFLKEFKISSTSHIPELKPLLTLRPDKVMLSVKRIHD